MKLRCRHTAAFTMIEIAIALGVIAFALVAIIGVLPSGMQVQRDNRQDTIINSDGSYLLEAIRNSAENIPDLAAYCEQMTINGQLLTNLSSFQVISNLCLPNQTNAAIFRSITGPAVFRSPGVPNFRYIVRSDISQVPNVATNLPWGGAVERNTYEVRLVFLWPVLPNGVLSDVAQKQVMRTLIAGVYTNGVFDTTEFRP